MVVPDLDCTPASQRGFGELKAEQLHVLVSRGWLSIQSPPPRRESFKFCFGFYKAKQPPAFGATNFVGPTGYTRIFRG